jgi:hypothetical protein
LRWADLSIAWLRFRAGWRDAAGLALTFADVLALRVPEDPGLAGMWFGLVVGRFEKAIGSVCESGSLFLRCSR